MILYRGQMAKNDSSSHRYRGFRVTLDQMTKTTDELAASSPNFRITPTRGATTSELTYTSHKYTEDLQWNRLSNLESSDPEDETIPLGHSAGGGGLR
ncbi:hypothetical protein AVEN_56144-1 [Araneus ventricosus]|uniref:Uncharacterized protein n=1 Tax=Araneus ventricosus TaxID=182803 RepID=A0A4Y2CD00_ARAVE|nr:hypothetical protein AVEN_56144-1 [Araneus ventricosus]